MANLPRLLADNVFEADLLHPTFVLSTAGDDVAEHEPWRATDNLRDRTWWTPGTTNATRYIGVDCQAGVPVDTAVLDRGHNLAGHYFEFQGTNDNTWVTYTTLVGCTMPAAAGGLASDPSGCRTPEGVWWKTFTPQTFQFYRVSVSSMGAGLAPVLTGVYLGASYVMPEYLDAPGAYDDHVRLSFVTNQLSRGGYRVRSRPMVFRLLNWRVRSMEEADYQAWKPNVDTLLRYGQPWWICIDDSTAAGCAYLGLFQSPGDVEYQPTVDPIHRTIALDFEEVAPVLYR